MMHVACQHTPTAVCGAHAAKGSDVWPTESGVRFTRLFVNERQPASGTVADRGFPSAAVPAPLVRSVAHGVANLGFSFRLPRLRLPGQSPAEMRNVLIIDDDADYRRTLAETLAARGWRVHQANAGEDGVALAKRHRPRVVLCDLMMPRGNGFQVCRALRAEPSLRRTRIIFTSGRDFEADRGTAHEAGADQYLTKTFSAARVLAVRETGEDCPRAGR